MTRRVLFCPVCAARFEVDPSRVAGDVVLLCTACGEASPVGSFGAGTHSVVVDAAERAISELSQPRVVVGHEVPASSRTIAAALRSGGFAPLCVRTGEQVLQACDPAMPERPAAIVLDVGVPGVLAFEVIDALRAEPETARLPVVLLASVFERTRYKRRPNQLYGADAYLELHHVPDRLAEVVQALLDHVAAPADRLQAPIERARAASLKSQLGPVDEESARALARRLLTDVALYHGEEVAVGVRLGRPFEGMRDALSAAGEVFVEAGGARNVFDDETTQFAARLVSRRPRVRAVDG